MKKYNMGANTTEFYNSLEDLRAAWGLRPITKKTTDLKKLESQKERFCNAHKCKACNQPMTFVKGTNIMVCSNGTCKGIKSTKIDKEGSESVNYNASYDILDSIGSEIGNNIFS